MGLIQHGHGVGRDGGFKGLPHGVAVVLQLARGDVQADEDGEKADGLLHGLADLAEGVQGVVDHAAPRAGKHLDARSMVKLLRVASHLPEQGGLPSVSYVPRARLSDSCCRRLNGAVV